MRSSRSCASASSCASMMKSCALIVAIDRALAQTARTRSCTSCARTEDLLTESYEEPSERRSYAAIVCGLTPPLVSSDCAVEKGERSFARNVLWFAEFVFEFIRRQLRDGLGSRHDGFWFGAFDDLRRRQCSAWVTFGQMLFAWSYGSWLILLGPKVSKFARADAGHDSDVYSHGLRRGLSDLQGYHQWLHWWSCLSTS